MMRVNKSKNEFAVYENSKFQKKIAVALCLILSIAEFF